MIAASFGLVTCSAVLVDLWGGITEAHFHFFVMIGVLTLYQDWTPFLVAIAFVVVHHGVGGVLDPRAVFGDNPQADKDPWLWAGIHGAFVLAASVAHIVAWRTNENQLLRDPLTGLPSRAAVPQQPQACARTARPGAEHAQSRCCSSTSIASR